MEQATTNVAGRTVARSIFAALLLALATALAVYPTSLALAQEEGEAAQEEAAQEEAAQPPVSDEATLSFELTVKNGLPEGTTVFGFIPAEGGITVPLADSDGDDVFTGSTTLDRFGPGPRPVPPGTEPVSLPVQIAARKSGGPIEVIRDYGVVPLDGDRTFRAKVNFKRDRGEDGTETPEETTPTTPDSGSGGSDGGGSKGGAGSDDGPDLTAPENGVDLNEDGSTDGTDGETAAATSEAAMKAHQASGGRALPATGGTSALPIVAGAAGALLVVGGLLVRRLAR